VNFVASSRSNRVRIGGVSLLAAVVIATAGLVPAGASSPPEGSLDTGFGSTGMVTTDIGGRVDKANAVAIQSDGKIVVAGVSANLALANGGGDFEVVRYTSGGVLDSTFGTGGEVATDFGGNNDIAQAVAIQPDGKIVVAGITTNSGVSDFAVARYNSNGTLDTSFDSDGKLTTDFSGNNDDARAVAIQPDGGIVVAGVSSNVFGVGDFALARYNQNGSLDTTFDTDGRVTTDIANRNDAANAVAIQSDGEIVAAGSTDNGNNYDFALVRYNPDGSLDTNFDGDGKVVTDIQGTADSGNALALQPDGGIVVAGSSHDQYNWGYAVARYGPDGSLDSSFGGTGTVTTRVAGTTGDDFANGVAVQPDGKIVVTGDGPTPYNGIDFATIRYLANGVLDPDFGSSGLAITTFGQYDDFGNAVAIQPDGKIVTVGASDGGESSGAFNFAVARIIGDATPPFGGRMIALPANTTTLSQPLYWIASDANTGVKSFDVRMRSAAYNQNALGSYSSFKVATSNTSGTYVGTAGHTVCFGVRPTDMANNVGAYGPDGCVAFPVDDPTATPTGTWTTTSDSHFYGGSARSSATAGASLSLPVVYRHLAVVVKRCVGCGSIKVYLGNTLLKTIATSAASTSYKTIVAVDASTVVKTGTLMIQQASAGKSVTVDGIAVSLR
jgi:uncharacterized delta-60 repeat protein